MCLLAVTALVATRLGAKRRRNFLPKPLLVGSLGNLVGTTAHYPSIVHHQVALLETTGRLFCGSVPDLGATSNCKFVFRHSNQTQEKTHQSSSPPPSANRTFRFAAGVANPVAAVGTIKFE